MLYNPRMKNRTLVTIKGTIQFDVEGYAELDDEQLEIEIAKLNFYEIVPESVAKKHRHHHHHHDEQSNAYVKPNPADNNSNADLG